MGQDLADYFRRPPALGDITMNFETADITTIVVPCSFEGEYRISIPTADLQEGNFSSLTEEDFQVLLDGITPAERARLSQHELPLRIVETPEEHAIAEFMVEREEFKGEIVMLEMANDGLRDLLLASLAEREMVRDGVQLVGEEFAKLANELAAERVTTKELEDLLIQSARWHLQLREQLVQMGISINTTEEGFPALTIDLMELAGSVERAFGG